MAEWTNLFDLGECTVKVDYVGSEAYSGVLGKGESDTFSHWSGDEYTISVSVQGSVALTADSTSANNMQVTVTPNYAQEIEGSRVSGVALFDTTNEAAGRDEFAGEAFFEEFDPASPDPMTLADGPGIGGYLAVYAAWGGA